MEADHHQLIKKMTEEVVDEIGRDIENEMIEVGSHSNEVGDLMQKTKHRKKNTEKCANLKKYDIEDLEQMKQSKIVEIKEIERQESILKRSTMMNTSNVTRSFSKLERSNFTEEEMRVIKEVLKKQKQYAKNLREKEEKLAEWVEQKRVEDEELKLKEMAEKCELRKQELKEKREQLKRKKEERVIRMEQEISKLKELKERKLLHQEMTQRAKDYLSKQDQIQYEQYLQRKKLKKLAVADIESHQKEYLSRKKQYQEKRSRMLQESRSFSKTELPSLHSKIWNKVKHQEEEEQKIIQYQRITKEDNISKRKVYSKNVKELFFPKLTNKTNQLVIKEENEIKKKPLKLNEEHMLGNTYMKSAHQNISSDLKEKEKKKSLEKVEENGGYSAFYKNYLKELKDAHKPIDPENLKSSAFEEMFSTSNAPQEVKLRKAMKMLQAKDRLSTKNKDSEMVDSIKSKLAVLKQMMR